MTNAMAINAALEAIDSAGLDAARWNEALSAIGRLLDAEFATLETFDRQTRGHLAFRASSLPTGSMTAYLQHYAPLCPRTKFIWNRPEHSVVYDHLIMDDEAIDRDPYYQEFLTTEGLRYFASGLIDRSASEQTLVTVQRSARAGHVTQGDIKALNAILPRLRNTLDLSRRIPQVGSDLRGALDWLRDGAAVLSRQGKLIYLNTALERTVMASDGLGVDAGALLLDDTVAAAALSRALAAILRQPLSPLEPLHSADIVVRRPSGATPFLVSVRALPPVMSETVFLAADPVAIIFVRDTEPQPFAMTEAMRQAFGLTQAEARFASALRQGIAPLDYADAEGLSHHTIYTYLRRLREKLGVQNAGALVRLLADSDPSVNGS